MHGMLFTIQDLVVITIDFPRCVKTKPEMMGILVPSELDLYALLVSDCLFHQVEAIAVCQTRCADYHCISSVVISNNSFFARVVMTYLRFRSWSSLLRSCLSRW